MGTLLEKAFSCLSLKHGQFHYVIYSSCSNRFDVRLHTREVSRFYLDMNGAAMWLSRNFVNKTTWRSLARDLLLIWSCRNFARFLGSFSWFNCWQMCRWQFDMTRIGNLLIPDPCRIGMTMQNSESSYTGEFSRFQAFPRSGFGMTGSKGDCLALLTSCRRITLQISHIQTLRLSLKQSFTAQ